MTVGRLSVETLQDTCEEVRDLTKRGTSSDANDRSGSHEGSCVESQQRQWTRAFVPDELSAPASPTGGDLGMASDLVPPGELHKHLTLLAVETRNLVAGAGADEDDEDPGFASNPPGGPPSAGLTGDVDVSTSPSKRLSLVVYATGLHVSFGMEGKTLGTMLALDTCVDLLVAPPPVATTSLLAVVNDFLIIDRLCPTSWHNTPISTHLDATTDLAGYSRSPGLYITLWRGAVSHERCAPKGLSAEADFTTRTSLYTPALQHVNSRRVELGA